MTDLITPFDIDRARQAVHEVVLSLSGLLGNNQQASSIFVSRPHKNKPDSKGVLPNNAYGLSVALLDKMMAEDPPFDKMMAEDPPYGFEDKIRALEMIAATFSRMTTLPKHLDPQNHIGDPAVIEVVVKQFEYCLSAQAAISAHWDVKLADAAAPARRPKVG